MNDRDELRRLRRFIVISWAFLLAIILGVTIWGSVQVRNLRSTLLLASSKEPQIIKGIDGKDGAEGAQGPIGASIIGPAGTDGSNATPEQIVAAVNQYFIVHPPQTIQGQKGDDGVDGQSLQVEVDALTCQLRSKYSSSDFWTTLAQLPIPCGVSQ